MSCNLEITSNYDRYKTNYNRGMCRSCGGNLVSTKRCKHCNEPDHWQCSKCSLLYDFYHRHGRD